MEEAYDRGILSPHSFSFWPSTLYIASYKLQEKVDSSAS
jgi:hypothetical protein